MADPIFTTQEAANLIALPKLAVIDDLENLIYGRDGNDEDSSRIRVLPADGNAFDYHLEITRTDEIEWFSLSLIAHYPGVAKETICRHDLHDSPHPNPDNRLPALIESGAAHRHVYNADDVIRYGRWDKYAELLDLGGPTDFAHMRSRLFWTAIQYMQIGMHDPATKDRILGLVQA